MKRARPLGHDGRAGKVALRERADGASHLVALVASRTSSPLLDRGVRGDVASLDGRADGPRTLPAATDALVDARTPPAATDALVDARTPPVATDELVDARPPLADARTPADAGTPAAAMDAVTDAVTSSPSTNTLADG